MSLRTRQLFLLSVFLFVFLTLPQLAQSRPYAQWNPDNGIKIRQGSHLEWYRDIARDENGNLMVAWTDTHVGSRNIYVMLMDANGEQQWTEPVAVAANEGRQESPQVISDGNGDWIITWMDYRYDFDNDYEGDIFMMKIDSEGNHLWTPNDGVPVCVEYPATSIYQIGVQAFTDGAGGAIAVWVDWRSGDCDIYAQRVDASGSTLWTDNGIEVAAGLGYQGNLTGGGFAVDTDGAGGIIAGWVDNRDPANINIYGQRVDANGNLVWNNGDVSGLPVCLTENEQSYLKLASDGESGAFFVWYDRRTDQAFGDIYMQRIDADGTIYWTENGEILTDDTGLVSPKFQRGPQITNVGAGEVVVVWEDTRLDPSNLFFDLFMQKISGTTTPVYHWGTDNSGLVLCDAGNDQSQARISSNGDGGIFASWQDEREYHNPNQDIYCQLVESDGSIAWDDDGLVVSNARLMQKDNAVCCLNNDRFASLWLDYQNGSPSILYQVYNSDGDEMIPSENMQLAYGLDFNARSPRFIKSADNYYIAWRDERSIGSSVVYMHRVDMEGNLLWANDESTANGISITPMLPDPTGFQNVYLDSISFTPDGSGGVIASWNTVNDDYINEVYIQRVTEDGSLPWGETGIEIHDAPWLDQTDPFVLYDGGSGYYVAFHQLDENWYQNILVTRVDENGQPVWDTPIVAASGEINNYIQDVYKFNDNSLLIVYKTEEESGLTDIYAQCVSIDGEVLWEESAIVTNEVRNQSNAVITGMDGDVVIAWEDSRRGDPIVDIYGQRISQDGTLHWTENGKSLVIEDLRQSAVTIGSASSESMNFWIAWQDNRNPDSINIYTMLFDESGDPALEPTSGILLSIDDRFQTNHKLSVLSDNSVYVAWENEVGNYSKDIYFKHVLSNGSIGNIFGVDYPDEGAILCDANFRQEDVQLISYENNDSEGILAVWQDLRMTGREFLYNIYAQKIFDGTVENVNSRANNLPGEFSLNTAYPNPFNPSTSIGYVVPQTANVRLSVYDVLGRKVTDLVNGKKAAGEYNVVWDGHSNNGIPVASGTYFVRLEADGVNIARSVILLK